MSETADNYRFSFEPESRRVTARFQGMTLADSRCARRLEETRFAPVYYFPRADVRMDQFERSDYVTYCPFKGKAAHYSLRSDEKTADNLIWSYEEPFRDAAHIRDYVAFYADQVEIVFPEDASATRAGARLKPAYRNPLVSWVLQEAPAIATARELSAAFARELRASGIPLWRIKIIIRILHPQVVAFSHHWHCVSGELVETTNLQRSRDALQSIQFGIALHVGNVTYGNIGTGNRLEFTGIGEAANLAARIESMCNQLGLPVLISADFAACAPDRVVSQGLHQLKGIEEPQQIYALKDPEATRLRGKFANRPEPQTDVWRIRRINAAFLPSRQNIGDRICLNHLSTRPFNGCTH